MTYRFDDSLGFTAMTFTPKPTCWQWQPGVDYTVPPRECAREQQGLPPTRYPPGDYRTMSWCEVNELFQHRPCGGAADLAAKKAIADAKARSDAALAEQIRLGKEAQALYAAAAREATAKQQAANAAKALAALQAKRAKEAADAALVQGASRAAYADAQQKIADATAAAQVAAQKQADADAATAVALQHTADADAAAKRAKNLTILAAVGGGIALLAIGVVIFKK